MIRAMSNLSEVPALQSAAVPSRWVQAGKQVAKVVLQIAVLSAIWVAMDVLRQHFGWSPPAGLMGFALLAVGLFSGLVKSQWLQSGTNWLMGEMLLFFVPAMLVVTEYPDLIRHQGLRILAVIVTSTACVLAVTAVAVDRVYRFELWLARRKSTRAVHALQAGAALGE